MSSRKKSRGRSGTPCGIDNPRVAPAPTGPTPRRSPPSRVEPPSPIIACDPPESDLDAETARLYEEALDDVHTRFILNLPPDELATSDRIFFQLEQAWWFYDDFVCDAEEDYEDGCDGDGGGGGTLPRFRGLKPFARKMFDISPLLRPMKSRFKSMWSEFSAYRRSISTYGTILLNADCTRVVLCRDWSGKSWTFPAGKVNQNERGTDAGARETYEETGFDPNCGQGRARLMREEADAAGTALPWSDLREEDGLVYAEEGNGKRRTCYVCRGVPESFPFEPVARKEISEVGWHDLSDLPKKSYAVLPFMGQLRRWIRRNGGHKGRGGRGSEDAAPKKRQKARDRDQSKGRDKERDRSRGKDKDKDKDRDRSRGKDRDRSRGKDRDRSHGKGGGGGRPSSRHSSRGKVREDDDLAASGLASPGDDKHWTAEEMFEANERLTGHRVDYDGNPHVFALEGFRGNDPHAFRVVGGAFLNSERGGELAPAPGRDKLQPLVRVAPGAASEKDGAGNDPGGSGELTPFFVGGVTPWGEVVREALEEEAAAMAAERRRKAEKEKGRKSRGEKAKGGTPSGGSPEPAPSPVGGGGSNDKGMAILTMLRGGEGVGTAALLGGPKEEEEGGLGAFLTDAEITARSQREKLGGTADPKQGADAGGAEAEDDSEEEDDDSEEEEGPGTARTRREPWQEDQYMRSLREWVGSLPEAPPTALFGDFRLDADAVMAAVVAVQRAG